MRVAEVRSYVQVEIEQPEVHALLRELSEGAYQGPKTQALVATLQKALLVAPLGGGLDPK